MSTTNITAPPIVHQDGYDEVVLGDPSDSARYAVLTRIEGDEYWRFIAPDNDGAIHSTVDEQNEKARLAIRAGLLLLQLNDASLSGGDRTVDEDDGARVVTLLRDLREGVRGHDKARAEWLRGNEGLLSALRPDWAESSRVFGAPGEAIEFVNSTMFAPITISQVFKPLSGAWVSQPFTLLNDEDTVELTAEEAQELIAKMNAAMEYTRPVDEAARGEELYRVAEMLGVKPSRLLSLKSGRSRDHALTKYVARCTADGAQHEALAGHRGEVHAWMDHHVREVAHDRRWAVSFAVTYSDMPQTFVEYRGPVKVTEAER